LISLGAPQNGVHDFPQCQKIFGVLCGASHVAFNFLASHSKPQNFIAPLTYWHDTDEESYRRTSTFLALINNEKEYNANYVLNLSNLQRLILVKYEEDLAIIPNESAWFGYYGSDRQEFAMEETEVYQKDKLGLEALKDCGKLIRLLAPGEHLQMTEDWFLGKILPFLKEN
jgi:palmitoyl-protein thioesterase